MHMSHYTDCHCRNASPSIAQHMSDFGTELSFHRPLRNYLTPTSGLSLGYKYLASSKPLRRQCQLVKRFEVRPQPPKASASSLATHPFCRLHPPVPKKLPNPNHPSSIFRHTKSSVEDNVSRAANKTQKMLSYLKRSFATLIHNICPPALYKASI